MVGSATQAADGAAVAPDRGCSGHPFGPLWVTRTGHSDDREGLQVPPKPNTRLFPPPWFKAELPAPRTVWLTVTELSSLDWVFFYKAPHIHQQKGGGLKQISKWLKHCRVSWMYPCMYYPKSICVCLIIDFKSVCPIHSDDLIGNNAQKSDMCESLRGRDSGLPRRARFAPLEYAYRIYIKRFVKWPTTWREIISAHLQLLFAFHKMQKKINLSSNCDQNYIHMSALQFMNVQQESPPRTY